MVSFSGRTARAGHGVWQPALLYDDDSRKDWRASPTPSMRTRLGWMTVVCVKRPDSSAWGLLIQREGPCGNDGCTGRNPAWRRQPALPRHLHRRHGWRRPPSTCHNGWPCGRPTAWAKSNTAAAAAAAGAMLLRASNHPLLLGRGLVCLASLSGGRCCLWCCSVLYSSPCPAAAATAATPGPQAASGPLDACATAVLALADANERKTSARMRCSRLASSMYTSALGAAT